MSKIPTAEELLKKNYLLIEDDNTVEAHTYLVVEQMIEFAELHVKAALIAASEQAVVFLPSHPHLHDTKNINRESIMNSYPIENIK